MTFLSWGAGSLGGASRFRAVAGLSENCEPRRKIEGRAPRLGRVGHLEASWDLLGASWRSLRVGGASRQIFGCVLESPGGLLGAALRPQEPIDGEKARGPKLSFCVRFDRCRPPGGAEDASWEPLGAAWGHLVRSWGVLGAILGCLRLPGAIWGHLGGFEVLREAVREPPGPPRAARTPHANPWFRSEAAPPAYSIYASIHTYKRISVSVSERVCGHWRGQARASDACRDQIISPPSHGPPFSC